jgi:PTH1 family peptidyl-tRNA hydrolase
MLKLLIGLGNPGSEYKAHRHNVGQMLLAFLHKEYGANPWQKKFLAEYSTASLPLLNYPLHLLFPLTYMNKSGDSVIKCTQFFKVLPTEFLVLHDELDLPFGQLMLKKGGGLAGHNGLKSISALCGTQDFFRLRIGIGRPQVGTVHHHVLSDFSPEEKSSLPLGFQQSMRAIECFFREGFEKSSSLINHKSFLVSTIK